MVASFNLWVPTMETQSDPIEINYGVDQMMKADLPKATRARKTGNKSAAQKKIPQRGLGVAQLERLRMQEQRKKITKFDQDVVLQQHPHSSFLTSPTTTPSSQINLNHQPHRQFPRFGKNFCNVPEIQQQPNFTFEAYNNGFRRSGGGGSLFHHDDQFELDRFRLGYSPSQNMHSNNVFDFCPKLKHGINNSENLGFKRGMYGCDFLGLNLGRTSTVDHSVQEEQEVEVEVVAVHRKGKTVTSNNVLMEYEFFPSSRKDVVNINNSSGASSSITTEASTETATAAVMRRGGDETSNFIDLSLKLSC